MAVVRHFVFIPIFEFKPPVMPFLLAVMLAAWIGGLKSGFFATVLNAGLIVLLNGEEIEIHLVSMSTKFGSSCLSSSAG